tara:strand:+ start:814 stop:1443 length:630 start_codon:yes stop_codon:yes gene_type:complete
MTKPALLQAITLGCIRQSKALFAPVSFVLQAGGALLVEGPNGAGKSSLLRLLASVATPATGTILWHGHTIQQTPIEYSEQLHYLGHTNGIRLGLTVAENIQLAGELSEQPVTNIDLTLSLLNLASYKHTQAQFLSAGQRRRVALARVFLIPRTLWILDEPLTSLDMKTQKILLGKIASHLKEGGACILTSHQSVAFEDLHLQTLALQAC